MIGEWCADEARGRLIPLTLIPMWDPDLAAQEVRRCAAKGSHAIAFSENPAALGLPSVHTDTWDPLWAACEETDTVVNMHIGSSSTFSKTSDDAPPLVIIALTFEGASHALVDWLTCGVLARFSSLRIALSEGQVGWMPFLLERLDEAWEHARGYAKTQEKVPEPPSTYVPGRVFGCVFDDQVGLALRDRIGMGQIMFETDYPHGDSTFPHSRDTAAMIAAKAACPSRRPGGCCAATRSRATAWTATASRTDGPEPAGSGPSAAGGQGSMRPASCGSSASWVIDGCGAAGPPRRQAARPAPRRPPSPCPWPAPLLRPRATA